MEALLDEDPCETQEEFASALGVTRQAISKRMHALGKIQKQGTWVPYDLKPRDVDQQSRSYEDIEKWLDSWIASKDEHFYRNGIRALPERWEKVVANDGQYVK